MSKVMKQEEWETAFIELFSQKVDEEPLYEYFHLYRKGLSPEQAVAAYLKENPDYLEKLEDLAEEKKPVSASAKGNEAFTPEAVAKLLEEQKRREEAKKRLSEFCPNCARKIGDKKRCKCGFKR